MDQTHPDLDEIAATLDERFVALLKGTTTEVGEVTVINDGDDIYLHIDLKLPGMGEVTFKRHLLYIDDIPNTEAAFDQYDEEENGLIAVAQILGLSGEQLKDLIYRANKDKHFT